ncbi:hypothetical protein O9992_08130 [Vibrio lentus]|nr:hypothetical protein [Vibrio lentus]
MNTLSWMSLNANSSHSKNTCFEINTASHHHTTHYGFMSQDRSWRSSPLITNNGEMVLHLITPLILIKATDVLVTAHRDTTTMHRL